jgi:hypothetical protein
MPEALEGGEKTIQTVSPTGLKTTQAPEGRQYGSKIKNEIIVPEGRQFYKLNIGSINLNSSYQLLST